MKIVLSILCTIILYSCSLKSDSNIVLFNNIFFKITKDEMEGKINANVNNLYVKHFNNKHIQIPLFKYIKHDSYKIFIGLPYNTSIKQLTRNQLKNYDTIDSSYSHNLPSYFNKYKKDSSYIVEYVSLINFKTLIYISVVSSNKELTDSLFSELKISKRIITN